MNDEFSSYARSAQKGKHEKEDFCSLACIKNASNCDASTPLNPGKIGRVKSWAVKK